MFEVRASAGQTLISEGEKGDNFYLVQSGSYAVFLRNTPGKAVKTYARGDAFGELALMYNCPRAATVKCTASGVLWALDRGTFRAILCSSQARRDVPRGPCSRSMRAALQRTRRVASAQAPQLSSCSRAPPRRRAKASSSPPS